MESPKRMENIISGTNDQIAIGCSSATRSRIQPHESTEVDDEILTAAEDDFITGMQIALALGGLLVFIMWLMGKLRFARPREEVAVAVDVDAGSGDVDIGVDADPDVDVSVDVEVDRR